MAHSRTPPPKTSNAIEEAIQIATELNLTALAKCLEEKLLAAEKQQPSYTDFFRQLLQAELSARQERRLTRNLKRANLGAVVGLDGFDFALRPKLEPRMIKELCNCQFVKQHRNILCFGRPGTGKTRICKTLAHAACLAGYSVLCVNTAAMIEDLQSSHVDGSFNRFFRRYTKPALLFLDEFGYEPFTATATNYLFRIVSARYEVSSIILTSNVGFTQWNKLFPSEAMAVATVDRLVDKATILRFTGKSCRGPKEIIGPPLEEVPEDDARFLPGKSELSFNF